MLVGAFFVAFFAGSLGALAALPYSTSWIERVDESQVLERPGQRFKAGPLIWDLELLRSAPSLQAFRDTFGAECSTLVGLESARCVADIIKAKSPRGAPKIEFVDGRFDPSSALRAHMEGAPGHCTTRSAMTATALLSMGIAARIVQVLPAEMHGHNLVEVWDPVQGWLLFDPHFDSSYLLGDAFLSAAKLSQIQGGLRWRRPSEGQPDPNLFAGATISYPEPWLYTRVGERCAGWPFRGCFAQLGPVQFRYGLAQRLALLGAGVFGISAVVWTLFLVWRSRRIRGREPAGIAPELT
ncbi:MAG: transglutaminase domain-containing protein [Archangium sp.]|nr:transglutaminase domain-containing protein [Archangium sp.]MDP3575846.1 transglutaminase domain-containing protein [Archangium sp.]